MVWGWVVFGVIVLASLWWFVHRDPMRYVPPSGGYLSPADGIVLSVQRVTSKKARVKKGKGGVDMFLDDFPKAAFVVVIMLKLWHVHTQRSPIPGDVTAVTHKSGMHLSATGGAHALATAQNEHVGILIKDKKRMCKVYMIAGMVARRVEPLVQKGEQVQQGQRIARIKLGSQVVLVLPATAVHVMKGDRVYAGVSEIAR